MGIKTLFYLYGIAMFLASIVFAALIWYKTNSLHKNALAEKQKKKEKA